MSTKVLHSLWCHVDTGGLYIVLTAALVEATLQEVVVYQGEDARVWTRPTAQFYDGRFKPMSQLAKERWVEILQNKVVQAEQHLKLQESYPPIGDLDWRQSDIDSAASGLREAHQALEQARAEAAPVALPQPAPETLQFHLSELSQPVADAVQYALPKALGIIVDTCPTYAQMLDDEGHKTQSVPLFLALDVVRALLGRH